MTINKAFPVVFHASFVECDAYFFFCVMFIKCDHVFCAMFVYHSGATPVVAKCICNVADGALGQIGENQGFHGLLALDRLQILGAVICKRVHCMN